MESEAGNDFESSEPVQTFKTLVDQCAKNWDQLADTIASEKAVIDICREIETLKEVSPQGGSTLPLHEYMPCKGKNAINTSLMFKRNGVRLTPGSKVQFWSDPDKINMLKQIKLIKD